jgi:NAD(P)-dependent dehydrogenase (short-subunit alcohol dehydrogenase family)
MDLRSILIDQMRLSENAFRDKVIVITGGGRGIGRELVRSFALLGGKVAIAELSESGKEVEVEVKQTGGEALFVKTDVANADDVWGLCEAVHTTFGTVDILINNAIRCPVVSVVEMEKAEWDEVMSINLGGTFLTCKAFLPDMLERGQGIIVNMVSTDAMPGLSAYIASKQGITGFSQSLAAEVGEAGVRVIAFGPGMVDTPGIRQAAEGLAPRLGMTREQFMSLSLHSAYEGLMPAEHAAAAAVYLVHSLAEECHGEVVNGYDVLERAGLIQAVQAQIETPTMIGKDAESAVDLNILAAQAVDHARQLAAMIVQTGEEFNKLPVFVRPMARNGFKSKAGQSLSDWQRNLAGLIELLDALQRSEMKPVGDISAWPGRFEKLASYFEGVPAETARFTRDSEVLKQVAQISAERVALIQALVDELKLIVKTS